MSTTLNPLVKWAQNKTQLFLTVEQANIDKPKFIITNNDLEFEANGISNDQNKYKFKLDFYKDVQSESFSTSQLVDGKYFVKINKCDDELWPRLTKSSTKLHWLRIDWTRWTVESDDSSDIDNINYSDGESVDSDDSIKSDEHIIENDDIKLKE